MSVIKKIKQLYGNFLVATSNVQQNALNDLGDTMLSDGGVQKVIQNQTMASALLNGEVTEEVKLLRARYYKVLDKMDSVTIKAKNNNLFVKENYIEDENGNANYDVSDDKFKSSPENGEHTYEYEVVDKFNYLQLKKVKTDELDSEYPLEMVIQNSLIYSSDTTKLVTTDYKFIVDYGEYIGKYNLRKHAEMVKIKMINNDESLLEFYIPFEDFEPDANKPHQSLINDLKKSKSDKELENLLIFGEIGFYTDEKDIGVKSMRHFVYGEPKFVRMVEFNHNYVIKFKVTNLVKNFYVGDNYTMDDLDKLYEQKAPRENK